MTCKINADTSDGLKIVSDTSGAIDFQKAGSTQVVIDTNGNIGAGTTSPTHLADAYTTIEAKGTDTNGSGVILATSAAGIQTQIISSDASGIGTIGTRTNHPCTFSINNTEQGRFDGSGNFYFNSGYGSSAIAYGVRAWVNFNGSGTPAARASGGVSSIGDRGTGKFTVNLSVTTPDVNGAVVATSSNNDTASSSEKTNVTAAQNSTSALYINLRDSSSNSQKDDAYINVVYLR